jgi:hypothetical protein
MKCESHVQSINYQKHIKFHQYKTTTYIKYLHKNFESLLIADKKKNKSTLYKFYQ